MSRKTKGKTTLLQGLREIKEVSRQSLRLPDIDILKDAVVGALRWYQDQELNGQIVSCNLGIGHVFQQPRGVVFVLLTDSTLSCYYYGYFALEEKVAGNIKVARLPDHWAYGRITVNAQLSCERERVIQGAIAALLQRQFS